MAAAVYRQSRCAGVPRRWAWAATVAGWFGAHVAVRDETHYEEAVGAAEPGQPRGKPMLEISWKRTW